MEQDEEHIIDSRRVEVELKAAVAYFFGPAVTHFEQVYSDKKGQCFLNTDVETSSHVVMVTLRESQMNEIMRRCHFINDSLYDGEKSLILLAPNYSDKKSIAYLEAELGVKVIRSVDELQNCVNN